MNKQLLALSTLVGTTIGVGLFGLPYVTSKVGFIPMLFYFLILGLVILAIQLMYGEISLRTTENHRLPGYVKIYLGEKYENLSHVSTSVGLIGSLLAYIVVGGEFLNSFLSQYIGGNVFLYSTIFFILGSTIIYFGGGPVSKAELLSLGIFFVILGLIFIKALPNINVSNLATNTISLKNIFLPYGVILFSLGGLSIIPEMKEILKDQEDKMKKIILWGAAIPAITYIFFIITVYGVTGNNTTQEAMTGLNLALGNGIVNLGFLFGIITTFTSFLTLGITLKKQYRYDKGLKPTIAWALACFPPFILYLVGLKDFINIIGFIGSFSLGIDITMISLVYIQARKKTQRIPAYAAKIPNKLVFAIMAMFILGIFLEIANVLI